VTNKAEVYNNGVLAGQILKNAKGKYIFNYDNVYYNNPDAPAISLTLSKKIQKHESDTLFPFFFGLLSEGINKQTQCRLLKIDEHDHFNLLLKTANTDTIGSITVKEIAS